MSQTLRPLKSGPALLGRHTQDKSGDTNNNSRSVLIANLPHVRLWTAGRSRRTRKISRRHAENMQIPRDLDDLLAVRPQRQPLPPGVKPCPGAVD